MWKYTIVLLSVAVARYSAVQAVEPKDGANAVHPPQQMMHPSIQSYMMISPSSRAMDFLQAFEMLRKEKTAGKVYFQLADGSTISHIIDMTLLPHSTLFLFHFNSPQGIRFQFVRIEDILNISYG